MNILISGRPSGRLVSKIAKALTETGHSVEFQLNIFDKDYSECLSKFDWYIAAAWNTKGDYKDDPINKDYAEATIYWLDKCKDAGVKTIFLGTATKEDSGFENCLYHICKDMCSYHAYVVLDIPYVWQPERIGSLAWKVVNGEKYKLAPGLFVYTTEEKIIENVCILINEPPYPKAINWDADDLPQYGLFPRPRPLEYWIRKFTNEYPSLHQWQKVDNMM